MEALQTVPPTTAIPGAVVKLDPIFVSGKIIDLPMHVTGPYLPLDSMQPIVSQTFQFFVSDSSKTSFLISKFAFNGGNNDFGKCTLGEVIDTGMIDLLYSCGDSLLFKYMQDGSDFRPDNGIEASSQAPYPNPAIGLIQIPFRALRETDVKLSLTNEAGEEVSSTTSHVSQVGTTKWMLNTNTFASGVYHYVLRSADGGRGNVSGNFVIQR